MPNYLFCFPQTCIFSDKSLTYKQKSHILRIKHFYQTFQEFVELARNSQSKHCLSTKHRAGGIKYRPKLKLHLPHSRT